MTSSPNIFCLEESRKSADYFGNPWRQDQCREGEGELVLWCVVHRSPIMSPGYQERRGRPAVRDPQEPTR